MKKQLLLSMLLATLPMAVVQADNNLSSNPFENDPMFKHFQKLERDMNKIFEEFNHNAFAGMPMQPHFQKEFSFSPSTDLKDKGDKYEIKMDIPGMDIKSIKIDIQENYLNVTAKNEEKRESKKDGKVIHQERHVGMIQRGMTLPKDADVEKYKNTYKDGVLTITIPKKK